MHYLLLLCGKAGDSVKNNASKGNIILQKELVDKGQTDSFGDSTNDGVDVIFCINIPDESPEDEKEHLIFRNVNREIVDTGQLICLIMENRGQEKTGNDTSSMNLQPIATPRAGILKNPAICIDKSWPDKIQKNQKYVCVMLDVFGNHRDDSLLTQGMLGNETQLTLNTEDDIKIRFISADVSDQVQCSCLNCLKWDEEYKKHFNVWSMNSFGECPGTMRFFHRHKENQDMSNKAITPLFGRLGFLDGSKHNGTIHLKLCNEIVCQRLPASLEIVRVLGDMNPVDIGDMRHIGDMRETGTPYADCITYWCECINTCCQFDTVIEIDTHSDGNQTKEALHIKKSLNGELLEPLGCQLDLEKQLDLLRCFDVVLPLDVMKTSATLSDVEYFHTYTIIDRQKVTIISNGWAWLEVVQRKYRLDGGDIYLFTDLRKQFPITILGKQNMHYALPLFHGLCAILDINEHLLICISYITTIRQDVQLFEDFFKDNFSEPMHDRDLADEKNTNWRNLYGFQSHYSKKGSGLFFHWKYGPDIHQHSKGKRLKEDEYVQKIELDDCVSCISPVNQNNHQDEDEDNQVDFQTWKKRGRMQPKLRGQLFNEISSLLMELIVKLILMYLFVSSLGSKCFPIQSVSGESCEIPRASVDEVTSCPTSQTAWLQRSLEKNCSSYYDRYSCSQPNTFIYHCLINTFFNATVEVCAPKVYINLGYCAEYNIMGELIQENYYAKCHECPMRYISSEAYKYQECYALAQMQYTSTTARQSDISTDKFTTSRADRESTSPSQNNYRPNPLPARPEIVAGILGSMVFTALLVAILLKRKELTSKAKKQGKKMPIEDNYNLPSIKDDEMGVVHCKFCGYASMTVRSCERCHRTFPFDPEIEVNKRKIQIDIESKEQAGAISKELFYGISKTSQGVSQPTIKRDDNVYYVRDGRDWKTNMSPLIITAKQARKITALKPEEKPFFDEDVTS